MNRLIRIGIAEDNPRMAEALRAKVELVPEYKVLWMAPDGKEALRQLEEGNAVDLILMDIRMPNMNGIEATGLVQQQYPEIAVVMSTVFDDEDHLLGAILAGATGYLMKDTAPGAIHAAIQQALEGGAPMSPLIAGKALQLIRNQETPGKPEAPDRYQLTPREKEILALLADGDSYQKIADRLFISYGTVRKHVEHIYRKMEVHGKVEAIRKLNQGS